MPVVTRHCSPWANAPSCATRWHATGWARTIYASTVDYLAAVCRLVVEETGLLPHANAGALFADELARLRDGLGQPGDDARVTGRRARGAPRRTRQGAGAPARHPGGGGRARHPVHHGDPGWHRRRPPRAAGRPARHRGVARPPRPRAGSHRPELPPQARDGDGAGRALPTRGSRVGRRRGAAWCCPPRSTFRRPRTSPTTWRLCSLLASTTGVACRPSRRTTSTPNGPGRRSMCSGTRPRRPATFWPRASPCIPRSPWTRRAGSTRRCTSRSSTPPTPKGWPVTRRGARADEVPPPDLLDGSSGVPGRRARWRGGGGVGGRGHGPGGGRGRDREPLRCPGRGGPHGGRGGR